MAVTSAHPYDKLFEVSHASHTMTSLFLAPLLEKPLHIRKTVVSNRIKGTSRVKTGYEHPALKIRHDNN
eukprot:3623663-Amphidinium_carterae.1